jgi:hypothetical protein
MRTKCYTGLMKITDSYVAGTGTLGVPPVKPVVEVANEKPPLPEPPKPQEQAQKPAENIEPKKDFLLFGDRVTRKLPVLDRYGPDGKMVTPPSASGTPREK